LIDAAFNTGEPQIADKVIYIPLVIRNQALGIVVTGQSKQNSEESGISEILAAFGNQVAIAIQNARLFAQIKADLDAAREQAQRLKIQIDQSHTDNQIDEIANSDFFRRLQEAKRDDE
jgi:GAF domain-containing protein